MKKLALLALTLAFALGLMLAPHTTETAQADPEVSAACWGQVTKLANEFKDYPSEFGEHAKEQGDPGQGYRGRAGLQNLARELYEDGVLAEPTIQALGSFLAALEGLESDACGTSPE